MWVESVLLVLVLAPRVFLRGTPLFPSPQKPTYPNSNSNWKQWREEPPRGFHGNFSICLFISCRKSFSRSHLEGPGSFSRTFLFQIKGRICSVLTLHNLFFFFFRCLLSVPLVIIFISVLM